MLAAALLCYGVVWIFRVGRLRLLLAARREDISGRRLFAVLIGGFGLNAFLPGKAGEIATIFFLRWQGVTGGLAAASVIQSRILDLLALLALMLTAGLPALHASPAPWRWPALAGLAALAITPMLVMTADRRQGLERLVARMYQKPRLATAAKNLNKFLAAYRRICRDGRLLVVTGLYSLIIWSGEGMVAWAIAQAASIPVPLAVCLLAVPLANLGKALPLTPGGVGVYEAVMAAVLHGAGVDWGAAVAVALADHMLKKACSIGIGLPLAMRLVGKRGWNWLKWSEERM
jgi:uncharacterized protein (TIRG00374 family)